jgi:fatty acid-binding protein DegV
MFRHASEASYAILRDYRARREQGKRSGSFSLRVLDSRTVCAGEAVLVCRALELLGQGQLGFEKMRRTLREEAERVTCLLVPGDPWYMRRRGLDGRGAGLGRRDYALDVVSDIKPVIELVGGRRRTIARARGFHSACGVAMARAAEAIGRGLGASALVLSFGGDPRVIREMPAYRDLEARVADGRIDLHFSVMSAMMATRVGPGAMTVAWLDAA